MDPDRWRRLESVLDAALDLPEAERVAFVRRSFLNEPALADEALSILQVGAQTDSVLDTPAFRLGEKFPEYDPARAAPHPERIGPYRIERLLGEGGMGMVYLAHRDDGEFHQRVALKLVRRSLHLDSRIVRRFREERRMLAALSHPGIARLFDGGLTGDNLPYFAMEFVEGLSIDRYCTARALTVEERLELFARVCDAVAHAHGKQIIHRDIKPSNILVTGSGDPRLLDFGIAKLIDADPDSTDITRRSERLLTPEYASPEQIRGEPVVEASDVYCLGVLLYEMLTARRPFVRERRSSHELERAVLEEDPTRPSDAVEPEVLRRRLKGDLDAIILTAMQKEPAHRYASAAQLGEDVRRHLRGEPVVVRAASRVYRLRRWARRHQVALSSTVAALLGAGLIFAMVMRWGRTPGDNLLRGLRLSNAQHITTDEGLELDPAISPDGTHIAYAAGNENAMRILVRPLAGGRPVVLTDGLAGPHRRPQWSPDGTRVLFMAEGAIWLVPVSGRSPRRIVDRSSSDSGGVAHSTAWSPDGNQVAWVMRDTIYVRPLEGGAPRALGALPVAHSLAWSPDGRWIAVVSGNHEFVHHRLGNLGPSAVYLVPARCTVSCAPVQLVAPTSLNTSPVWLDPSLLVFVSNRGGSRDLFAVRVEGRGRVNEPVRLSAGQDLHTVSAAADGRTLAYTIFRQSSNVWSIDVSAGSPRRLSDATRVTSGRQTVEGLDLSSDGKWLAYDANRAGQQDIYVVPSAGGEGEPERVIATPDDDFHPSWSPDGTAIAFYTFRDGVRRAATAPARGGPIRLVHPDGPVQEEHSPVWMRDGQGLVYYRDYPSGGSHLFQVRRTGDSTWSPERQVTQLGGWALTFSADGRRATYMGPTRGLVRQMGPDLDEASSRLLYDGAWAGASGIQVQAGNIAPDGSAYIAKGEDRIGPGFWSIPLDGEAPRLLLRLDDPSRTAPRPEFTTDGRRLFFVLAEREADIWVVRLEER